MADVARRAVKVMRGIVVSSTGEYSGKGQVFSSAGVREDETEAANNVVMVLESMGYVETNGDEIRLTSSGLTFRDKVSA